MNKHFVFLLGITSFSLAISCSGEHEIGMVSVSGVENVSVRFTQSEEFDMATSIYYEVIDSEKNTILDKHLLTGTHDYVADDVMFSVRSYDSILYVSYNDPYNVYAIFDLKSKKGYPKGLGNHSYKEASNIRDSLLKVLNRFEPKLIGKWNR